MKYIFRNKNIKYFIILLTILNAFVIFGHNITSVKKVNIDLEFKTYNLRRDSINKNKPHTYKNNINFELGGTGITYSLGYERSLSIKEKSCQSLKISISYLKSFADQIFIPVDYNFYLGKGRTKLLVGAGIIGLIGTNASPNSVGARQDYIKLYNQNPYTAISKYGTDHYEKAFDLAYTAKLGFKYIGKRVDFYAYYNCFYIRFSTSYNLQPAWLGVGLSFKLGK